MPEQTWRERLREAVAKHRDACDDSPEGESLRRNLTDFHHDIETSPNLVVRWIVALLRRERDGDYIAGWSPLHEDLTRLLEEAVAAVDNIEAVREAEDLHDRRLTEARNALTAAGVPDMNGDRALNVRERIEMLATTAEYHRSCAVRLANVSAKITDIVTVRRTGTGVVVDVAPGRNDGIVVSGNRVTIKAAPPVVVEEG